MAYFSELDNRSKPKGSRDPLGFELIWTHYGRRVIGNLTTITSSLTNFAVALLGFHWANEIYGGAPAGDRRDRVLEAFLRYEQLAGYLRYLGSGGYILGITRVSRRMDGESADIRFGMEADQQILSDQTSYGLWGFYASPMWGSGLIEGDSRRPTRSGRMVAETFEKGLDKDALISLFLSDKKMSRDELVKYAKPFVAALADERARAQLLGLLMQGDGSEAVQQEVWRITRALARENRLPESFPGFIAALKEQTASAELEERLDAIDSVERLLVAVNNLFGYCRRKDGEKLQSVLETLQGRYDYTHMTESVDFGHAGSRGVLLEAIRSALRSGDTETALRRIFELNHRVMEDRGGAPWIEVEADGRLRVRVPSETAELRPPEELKHAWDYDYFMAAYLAIAREALL